MYENGVSNFEEKIKEFSLSGEKSFKEIQVRKNFIILIFLTSKQL